TVASQLLSGRPPTPAAVLPCAPRSVGRAMWFFKILVVRRTNDEVEMHRELRIVGVDASGPGLPRGATSDVDGRAASWGPCDRDARVLFIARRPPRSERPAAHM